AAHGRPRERPTPIGARPTRPGARGPTGVRPANPRLEGRPHERPTPIGARPTRPGARGPTGVRPANPRLEARPHERPTPLGARSSRPGARKPGRMKIGPPPVVFVVDDDPAMRDSLRWLIESTGLQVETFADAQTFLARVRPELPGCLVLDVRMPGMSGLD